MAKKKYRFDPETLTFEVITAPLRLRVYNLMRKLLIGFILASVINVLFSYFFYTPKMARIDRENSELIIKYGILQDKVSAATRKIKEIKNRDDNVYRLLFAADTLDIPEIYNTYPESKYAALQGDLYTPLMTKTWLELDQLARYIYLESVSFDDLQALSLDKEKMAVSIPAIWPIDRRYLRSGIGKFGGRNHPILGRFIMHDGIDLPANKGTEVYATGDGVVELAANLGNGYGRQILINHGFGYKTRYAHLNSIDVTVGQHVKRGEIIGCVGNTGRSTASHLHYEVRYRGRPVDPIAYFRQDMDEEEFERIIESAKATIYEILE